MNKVVQDSEQSLAGRLVKGPSGFRKLLQRLGPTFIKIGQFLALRPDIVSQEYCDELMRLLDRVPPFPWQEARAILREDLGGDPMEIFAFVNPRPVAAGSLAQTHMARMKDGTEVAIKIQRPNIRTTVLRDLKRARLMARLLDFSGVSLIVSPREVVQELTEWMLQEIDFSHELVNLTRLYRLTVSSTLERVPRPYPNLSGPRVLTMEYLRGVPVSELLLALRSGRSDEVERVNALGIDCNRLAENLVAVCLRQIFRYQFFHADLHPGNLFALPGDVIGFVDFGLCDELDETVRERQMRYLSAVYSGDVEQMFKSLTEIFIPSEQTDINAFRRDFLAETRTWISRRRASRQSHTGARPDTDQSSIAQWMIRVMRTARHHGLKVPPRILSMYRALLTAETVAHQLGTKVDLGTVGRRFFEPLQLEEALRALELKNIQPIFLSLLALLRDSPGQLHHILSEVSDGRFALKVDVSEVPKVVRARNRRIRLLVTSVLSVGIALLLTIPDLPKLFGVSLQWPLSGALILLYIWTFIQWRRLR